MKNNEIKLEQYFDKNGKLGWSDMVSWSSNEYWTDSDLQKDLKKNLGGDAEIAKVTYAKLGDASLEWIHKRIPALDYLTPIECLETPELIKRFKECLMRMP